MDVQSIIVLLLFAGAAFFLGRMIYNNLRPKKGSGSGCGANCKCGVDFSEPPSGR